MQAILVYFCVSIVIGCPETLLLYNQNLRYSTNLTKCINAVSETETIDILNYAQNESNYNDITLRAIGKSFSFSAVGMMENNINKDSKLIMVNLTQNMSKLININTDSMTATFEGGIGVYTLLNVLQQNNLALPHYGGPGSISFIGSAMTGTHSMGSGINSIGTMASNIISLRMIVSNSSIIIANTTYNKNIFDAVRISFGSLGIITQFTVNIIPTFNVTRYPDLVLNEMNNLSIIFDTFHRYIVPGMYNYSYMSGGLTVFRELFSFRIKDNVTNNNLNKTVPIYNNSCGDGPPCTDVYYHAVYFTPQVEATWGKHQEVEFFVDSTVWIDAYQSIIQYVYEQKYSQLWNNTYDFWLNNGGYIQGNNMGDLMIQIRWVGQDNIWLSPAYNRTVVQIGLWYQGNVTTRSPNILFNEWVYRIHKILQQDFSPVTYHWGKQSFSVYCDLQQSSYDKLEEFKQLRNELDPNQLFVNQFVRDKLGLCDINNVYDCCCTNYSCNSNTPITKDNDNEYIVYIIIIGIIIFIAIGLIIVLYIFRKRQNNSSQSKPDELSLLKLSK